MLYFSAITTAIAFGYLYKALIHVHVSFVITIPYKVYICPYFFTLKFYKNQPFIGWHGHKRKDIKTTNIIIEKKSIAEEQLNASTIDFLKEFFYLKGLK